MHSSTEHSCPHCGVASARPAAALFLPMRCPACGHEYRARNELGGYELGVMLARGGLSVIFQAVHASTGEPCAVKILQPPLAAEEEDLTAFGEVIAALRGEEHPHRVQILAGGVREGFAWVAMEWLLCGSLAARLETGGKLRESEALELGVQIASALAAAHRAGISHRDLEPNNLVFSDQRTIKVTDFGLGGVLEPAAAALGSLWGQPCYCPPERLRGEDEDERGDMYALGAVLWHAITGTPPYDGEPVGQLMAQLVEAFPLRVEAVVRPIQTKTVAVMNRLLSREKERRFQTWEDALAALTDARDTLAALRAPKPAPLMVRNLVPVNAPRVVPVPVPRVVAVAVPRAVVVEEVAEEIEASDVVEEVSEVPYLPDPEPEPESEYEPPAIEETPPVEFAPEIELLSEEVPVEQTLPGVSVVVPPRSGLRWLRMGLAAAAALAAGAGLYWWKPWVKPPPAVLAVEAKPTPAIAATPESKSPANASMNWHGWTTMMLVSPHQKVPVKGGAKVIPESGDLKMQGNGTGIDGTHDECPYQFRSIEGDWTLTARVAKTNGLAGLAVRVLGGGEQVCVSTWIGPDGMVASGIRKTPNTPAVLSKDAVRGKIPGWLQLSRRGGKLTARYSADEKKWKDMAVLEGVPLPPKLTVGFIVWSGKTDRVAEAVFDKVALTPKK